LKCGWAWHAGVEDLAVPVVRETPSVRCLVRPSLPGNWMVFDTVLGSPMTAGMEDRALADRQCLQINKNEWSLPSKEN
jgi:hypothetical protein